MATQNMKGPSGFVGGAILLPDGTSLSVNSSGVAAVPVQFVNFLEGAGWEQLAFGITTDEYRSGSAQASVATTGSTTSTPYGYTTAAQADAIPVILNEIRATLIALGVWKGSA